MQQPSAPGTDHDRSSASRGAVTFLLCAVFFTLTVVAVGVVEHGLMMSRPDLGEGGASLIASLLNLGLLLVGFLWVAHVRAPGLRALSAVGFVRRPSAGREAGGGAALGWAVGVALVLPGLLTMQMHSSLVLDRLHAGASLISIVTLICFVLARQLVLCGLPFRSLTQATSPTFACVAFAGVAALLTLYTAHGDVAEALLAALAQCVFGIAALRTRAIWLGTGLQVAWGFAITVLFGFSSFLWPGARGVVRSSMYGSRWSTGDALGPEAAIWAWLVVLAALVAVWRLTRDYAWHYTYDPIVGAGYPMDVPPPAEHVRMEQTSQGTANLVQIGGTGTQSHTPASPQNADNRPD